MGDLVSEIVGADVNYDFPAYVGIGGVKVIASTRGVRPYGLGGFGAGRLQGKVEVEGSDVTDLLDEYGYLNKDEVNFTKPLFEVGGGIAIPAGNGYFDLSYRFRKFLDTGEPINMSAFYAGGGFSF